MSFSPLRMSHRLKFIWMCHQYLSCQQKIEKVYITRHYSIQKVNQNVSYSQIILKFSGLMASVVHMITFYLFTKIGKENYNITCFFVCRSAHCSFAYSWKTYCRNPHASWCKSLVLHGYSYTGMQSVMQEATSTCLTQYLPRHYLEQNLL